MFKEPKLNHTILTFTFTSFEAAGKSKFLSVSRSHVNCKFDKGDELINNEDAWFPRMDSTSGSLLEKLRSPISFKCGMLLSGIGRALS